MNPLRAVTVLLAIWYALSGLWMLFDPTGWYEAIPGVPETGPFNPHFVLDIGFAFLASGIGFALAATARPDWRIAATAAAFPVLHAGLHIYGLLTHPNNVLFELGLIVVPAVAAIAVSWPRASTSSL